MSQVLCITETLVTGGAETFVLRLVTALRQRGIDASLFVLRGELINQRLVQSIAPNVPVRLLRLPALPLLLKIDGVLFRFGAKFSLVRWLQARALRRYLVEIGVKLAHSHLFTADVVTSRACSAIGLPWVTTMHGDYLAFEDKGRIRSARIQNFRHALREVESSVSHLICITEQQARQLRRLLPLASSQGRISKVYNGYALPQTQRGISMDVPDALKDVPETAFVIGMVARGIQDKGWDVMLMAFEQLDFPDAWLVLVGDGDYVQALKGITRHAKIKFVGNVVDPLRYITRFDVGCLPSRIPTESLPTVIIEYLVLEKPVIATDVGEVARMIDADSDSPAGLLIGLDSVEVMASQMKVALERLYRNPEERARLQTCARVAARKFDMDKCVDEYLAVYEAAQG